MISQRWNTQEIEDASEAAKVHRDDEKTNLKNDSQVP
jgi:hypothetical protein